MAHNAITIRKFLALIGRASPRLIIPYAINNFNETVRLQKMQPTLS